MRPRCVRRELEYSTTEMCASQCGRAIKRSVPIQCHPALGRVAVLGTSELVEDCLGPVGGCRARWIETEHRASEETPGGTRQPAFRGRTIERPVGVGDQPVDRG